MKLANPHLTAKRSLKQ